MAFSDYKALGNYLADQDVRRAIMKRLSENDNSKQQIYLGGSFEALNEIPFRDVKFDNSVNKPNFKAAVNLSWLDDDRNVSPAPHAQLILYPKYPEVRLSGFLRGCPTAPSRFMHPIPKSERRGDSDGRVLILGLTTSDRVVAYLATPESPVAKSLSADGFLDESVSGIFSPFPLSRMIDEREQLLAALTDVVTAGWHESCRLNKNGEIVAYTAPNAGGYTLEALLGVVPNAISGPDLLGWEVKAYSTPKITLMTSEPDGGYYGRKGVFEFLLKFGRKADSDTYYFTGIHRAGIKNDSTGMRLIIDGFDFQSGKILKPESGIVLEARDQEAAAIWSYSRLLEHWGRKHNNTVYVQYTRDKSSGRPRFHYGASVWMGSGTDFSLFLRALAGGAIVYDPAPRARQVEDAQWNVKARNQFRIHFNGLYQLYHDFRQVQLSET